jgi:RNA polymerase sigma factor (TIGR02999 family)
MDAAKDVISIGYSSRLSCPEERLDRRRRRGSTRRIAAALPARLLSQEIVMPEPPFSPPQTPDALFSAVYDRLKAIAGRRIAEAGGRTPTLDTTALVHELYIRISARSDLVFAHPNQFFVYAARAMRNLLIDRARSHMGRRASGVWIQVTLTASHESLALESAERAIALDSVLSRLAALDARAAQIVELRYFAGLTSEQAAEALGVAKRTADRDWTFAMAFLKTDLG